MASFISAVQTQASSCFTESENAFGSAPSGTVFKTDLPLIKAGQFQQEHRLSAIKLCEKAADLNFDGIQFQIGTPYENSFENLITLYSHGNTSLKDPENNCRFIRMTPDDYI